MDFSNRYGPWSIVAGASDGVGASVAQLLSERGVNVVLVARRQDKLDEVAGSLATETRTIALDLSRPEAAAELATRTADLAIGSLIYNAGADPHMSTFLDTPAEEWLSMIARNCSTVVSLAHHFATPMVERGRGGIVLVSSAAAWAGASHIAVYGATKGFDLLLGESLWAELHPLGVDVLSMILLATDTPAYREVLGGREADGLASPDDVARDMLDHLADGPTFPPDPFPVASMPRRQAVDLLTTSSAWLFE